MVRFRLLGMVRVEREGEALELPRSRKARALLAYLAAEPGEHTRSSLCDLLWVGPADPRASLRWALSKCRQALGEDADLLLTDRATVALDHDRVAVDVDEFRQSTDGPLSRAPIESLTSAAELCGAEFLEGLELDDCPEYDAWKLARREALRRRTDEVLRELTVRHWTEDPLEALRYARARQVADPYGEGGYVDVVRLLGRLGRPSEALEEYDRCVEMLSRFDAQPSYELESARSAIVHGTSDAPSGSPAVATRAPGRRTDEHMALLGDGRRAIVQLDWDEVAVVVEEGLRAARGLDEPTRSRRELSFLELAVHPGMRGHRPSDLDSRAARLVSKARKTADAWVLHRALYLMANLAYQRGDVGAAVQRTLAARDAAEDADVVTFVRGLADSSRCLMLLERDVPRARRLADQAATVAEILSDDVWEVDMARGLVAHHDGELAVAINAFEAAIEGAWEDDDPWWRDHCLLHLAMIALEQGEGEELGQICSDRLSDLVDPGASGSEAALATALCAFDRVDSGEPGVLEEVDAALERLRAVDSQWMIAYVQNHAARMILDLGEAADAFRRASAALTAAGRVARTSEVAVAHVLSARAKSLLGEDADAEYHREAALELAAMSKAALSARAQRYVDSVG